MPDFGLCNYRFDRSEAFRDRGEISGHHCADVVNLSRKHTQMNWSRGFATDRQIFEKSFPTHRAGKLTRRSEVLSIFVVAQRNWIAAIDADAAQWIETERTQAIDIDDRLGGQNCGRLRRLR